ncbi:MAG: hypothetical protein IKW46_02140 [Bacteroidaceae bacterium]|nr:hypothetical protein [Bacteroidaceae bacterium]
MRLFAIIFCLLLISCGTTKKNATETTVATITTVTTTEVSEEKHEASTEVTDEYEVVTETTVTTKFDTNKVDSNGAPVIESRVEKTVQKSRGSNNTKQTNTTNNISATKEENVNENTNTENVVHEEKEESKQMKYAAELFFGIAFLVLAILAFWVFTKYRRR